MQKFNIIVGYNEAQPDDGFINKIRSLFEGKNKVADNKVHPAKINIDLLRLSRLGVVGAGLSGVAPSEEEIARNSLDSADLLILDLSNLHFPDLKDSLVPLLADSGCDLLFINSRGLTFERIILKYNGSVASSHSILSFCRAFPDHAQHAVNTALISPEAFTRQQIAREKQFVQKMASLYGGMGFIKLPFYSVTDFVSYALKTRADLLVLPQSDLNELLRLPGYGDSCSAEPDLPAVFIAMAPSEPDDDHFIN